MFEVNVIPEKELKDLKELSLNSDYDQSQNSQKSSSQKSSDASIKSINDSGLFSASSTISRKTMSSKTVTLTLDGLVDHRNCEETHQ